jgi:hypothetical protein
MGAQRQQGLFGALVMSVLLLSACSSGTSESASPVTPAAESAAAVEAADDYRVGDTGPGGGVVFYDAGSTQSWGRYLEAGPLLPPTEWCGEDWELDVPGTQATIGAGAANTELMADACVSGAARSVSDYDGGGKTDWFLPSKDELNELYEQRDAVGGFGLPSNDWSSFESYWSSTQSDASSSPGSADVAWVQYFDGGEQSDDCKCNFYGVRPIRAF